MKSATFTIWEKTIDLVKVIARVIQLKIKNVDIILPQNFEFTLPNETHAYDEEETLIAVPSEDTSITLSMSMGIQMFTLAQIS